jgi:hypothetical protein
MNCPMTKEEFEALPFRDDISGDYIRGKIYKARAYKNTVFVWMSQPGHRPDWAAYGVDFRSE